MRNAESKHPEEHVVIQKNPQLEKNETVQHKIAYQEHRPRDSVQISQI